MVMGFSADIISITTVTHSSVFVSICIVYLHNFNFCYKLPIDSNLSVARNIVGRKNMFFYIASLI